jgi:hypothetical protein
LHGLLPPHVEGPDERVVRAYDPYPRKDDGLEAQRAGVAPKTTEDELRQRVMATQWTPAYPSFATSKL